jgi:hypothetical protein
VEQHQGTEVICTDDDLNLFLESYWMREYAIAFGTLDGFDEWWFGL